MDGQPYTVYRVGLLIQEQYSNDDRSRESIVLSLHYEVVVDETSKKLTGVINLLLSGENEAYRLIMDNLGL